MVAEHERAIGAWHSEWEVLSDALALAGGAAAAVREVTEALEVYPEKMLENLECYGRPAARRERDHRRGTSTSGVWRRTTL